MMSWCCVFVYLYVYYFFTLFMSMLWNGSWCFLIFSKMCASGQRYMICVTLFCTLSKSKKKYGNARNELLVILAGQCVFLLEQRAKTCDKIWYLRPLPIDQWQVTGSHNFFSGAGVLATFQEEGQHSAVKGHKGQLFWMNFVGHQLSFWISWAGKESCQLCFSRVLCRRSLWGRFISLGPTTAGAAPAVAATPAASTAQRRHAGAGSWSQHHDPNITIPLCAVVSKKDQNNQLDSYLWLLLPPQFR